MKFLLKHLPEMGSMLFILYKSINNFFIGNNEQSILYLKLFKLVFSAVSYTQVNPECENMLKVLNFNLMISLLVFKHILRLF